MKKTLIALGTLAAFAGAPAQAQAWPTKPVRIINPYAAGGPTELVARELANALSVDLGQQFIVESRPGGGTIIGLSDRFMRREASAENLAKIPPLNSRLHHLPTPDVCSQFASSLSLIC